MSQSMSTKEFLSSFLETQHIHYKLIIIMVLGPNQS